MSFLESTYTKNIDLSDAWETLGRDDPLWTILTAKEKAGNKWKKEEFFATGEADGKRFLRYLSVCNVKPQFGSVLDFGCGVGRLSRFWAKHADAVTGVDVSSTMIKLARDYNNHIPNLRFVHNVAPDLKIFGDNEFHLIFSYICLQHIPWSIAANYIVEFGRLCAKDGYVLFQLPTRPCSRHWIAVLRKKIIEGLPFGLGKVYRIMRGRSSASFDVTFTPTDTLLLVTQAAGLKLLRVYEDHSSGVGTSGLVYLFTKN